MNLISQSSNSSLSKTMHFFSSTYSKKGVKRTFDFSGRSLHPDIPPAKERIKDYKRKILEVNDNSEF